MSTNNVVGRVGNFNIITREDCFSSHAGLLLVKDFVDRLGVSEILDTEFGCQAKTARLFRIGSGDGAGLQFDCRRRLPH